MWRELQVWWMQQNLFFNLSLHFHCQLFAFITQVIITWYDYLEWGIKCIRGTTLRSHVALLILTDPFLGFTRPLLRGRHTFPLVFCKAGNVGRIRTVDVGFVPISCFNAYLCTVRTVEKLPVQLYALGAIQNASWICTNRARPKVCSHYKCECYNATHCYSSWHFDNFYCKVVELQKIMQQVSASV